MVQQLKVGGPRGIWCEECGCKNTTLRPYQWGETVYEFCTECGDDTTQWFLKKRLIEMLERKIKSTKRIYNTLKSTL